MSQTQFELGTSLTKVNGKMQMANVNLKMKIYGMLYLIVRRRQVLDIFGHWQI